MDRPSQGGPPTPPYVRVRIRRFGRSGRIDRIQACNYHSVGLSENMTPWAFQLLLPYVHEYTTPTYHYHLPLPFGRRHRSGLWRGESSKTLARFQSRLYLLGGTSYAYYALC